LRLKELSENSEKVIVFFEALRAFEYKNLLKDPKSRNYCCSEILAFEMPCYPLISEFFFEIELLEQS
jgi:hypothetical protein